MSKEVKEEAERIIELFKPYAEGKPGFALEKQQAKQCALICLNEKIKTAKKTCSMFEIVGLTNSDLSVQPVSHYEQVKEYIQNNY